jgi:heptosyltransferase-3
MFCDIKRILILKLKHIGDVLLATPCIRALHETFPSATISFLTNEGTEAMLQNHPLLHEILVYPRLKLRSSASQRFAEEWKLARDIRKRKFDMTVDLTSGDRSAWYSKWSGARYRLAYDPQGAGFWGKKYFYNYRAPLPQQSDLHEVQKNLGILSTFDIQASNPRLELYPSPEDFQSVEKLLRELRLETKSPFVVIHPTSRWLFKCWDNERFAQLIDWIESELRISVVLTCGPDERECKVAQTIASKCNPNLRKLLGTLTLRQWAALVKHASLFIGVDSAPMHIAASQNTSSLALFGPTGFENWRPWAVPHTVLVHDCPCSKDRLPHCDWNLTRACMQAITLEEAQAATLHLIQQNSSL